jgi:hypothetical protein
LGLDLVETTDAIPVGWTAHPAARSKLTRRRASAESLSSTRSA